MSKILIVSLLQVVLAKNILDARPHVGTNYNNGRQLYYRDPGNRNLEVHSQNMGFRNADFNNEKSSLSNSEYANEPSIAYGEVDHRGIDNFGHRNHHVSVNRNRQYTNNDELDLSSYTRRGNFDLIGTEYNTRDNNHQTSHDQVRTNINSSENNGDLQPTNEYIELTTVPVLLLTSETLKTNPKIHNRFADNESSNDNQATGRNNNDALIFAEVDNRKPDTLDKPTTDNEVRFNKDGGAGNDKEDKWIWGEATNGSTTSSTIKPTTDGGLDDRISFNGDGCPVGEAKVKGICTPKH